jgi:DNA-binding PadR family transcriptional regulator
MLNEMEDEGLIEAKTTAGPRRGRPRKLITCTMLGLEFLDAYRKAATKPLRARKADLERAVKDAEYTERLVARGLSPFELFMELNNLARNIGVSSEATETARRA